MARIPAVAESELPDIPRQEFADRQKRAKEMAATRGLDGLLVWSKGGNNFDTYADVFYLANHYTSFPQLADNPPHWFGRSHAGLVLPIQGNPTLVVDIPDPRLDLIQVDDVRFGRDVVRTTVNAVKDAGLQGKKIGLVAHETLLHDHFKVLAEELPAVKWADAQDIVDQLRLVKSEAEVRMLKHASWINMQMMSCALEMVEPGRTDGDVVGEALRVGAGLGTQPWLIYMTTGPISHHHQWDYLPTWNANRKYVEGDIIHPDIFGSWRGYFYDMQRSAVAGRKPSPAARKVLEDSREMILSMIEGIRPGITVHDVWMLGCNWLESHGYESPLVAAEKGGLGTGGANFPGFGHQVGLAMEKPFVMRGDETVLQPNMVFAIEVDLGPQGSGAAYEDIVVITASGCENITAKCPGRWWD